MCGITGWISFHRDLTDSATQAHPLIERMTATMACRGPDDGGLWRDRHVALGHRRLAVIDPAGGAQPMSVPTPDGPLVLVYSGEVYNYRELRAELSARGHRFRTTSDTEVVLRGFLEWDTALAEKLTGMYAFAVWDARDSRLVLLRDRLGIKPLYYQPTGDGLLFGSEPQAILAHPLASRAVDAEGLRELFTMHKTPGHAVWRDMREVRPGTLVVLDRSGTREHVYWRLRSTAHTDDAADTVARVRSLAADSVRGQLHADVPVGALLSGGLDSSALSMWAAGHAAERGERLRSFTVDFAAGERPDTPYARLVAGHFGTEHADIVLGGKELADPEVRRAMVRARGLPTSNGDRDASLYLLFRAVRERVTVALSGECADEVFAGYPWFHNPAAQRAPMFPWLVPAATTAPAAPANADTASGSALSPDVLRSLHLLDHLRDGYADAVGEVEFAEEDEHERRMRVICYLNLTRFLPVMLDRKDRASMAVGLEVRVPFCDHKLVEYAYNVPWSLKAAGGRDKALLRDAVAGDLPEAVLSRHKLAYPATTDPHYVAALRAQGAQLLAEPNHPAFALLDRDWLAGAVRTDAPLSAVARQVFEGVLDLAMWLEVYRPELPAG